MVLVTIYSKSHPNKHKPEPPTQYTEHTKNHLDPLPIAYLQCEGLRGPGVGGEIGGGGEYWNVGGRGGGCDLAGDLGGGGGSWSDNYIL